MTGSRRWRAPWSSIDPWLSLGTLGALLALGLLLVHVPASLWAGNTIEFHWGFATYLRVGAMALAAGLALAVTGLWLLPRAVRPMASALVCAVGLCGWTYASFLSGRMDVLDGTAPPLEFSTRVGAWELPLLTVLCLAAAAAIVRARRMAAAGLVVLNVGLAIATTGTVWSARAERLRAPEAHERTLELFRFSPQENILVLLLDGLQGQVVADVFEQDPQLRSAFDGFGFYVDAVGVAPTTFLSLPAIHSGLEYRRRDSLDVYFEEAIRLRSFMSHFAEAGYDTALVNPVEGLCPEGTLICTTSEQVLRSSGARLRSESLRLLDLSLFRLSPFRWKERIYADGNWFAAGRFDRSEEIARIFEHNQLLEDMARRLVVADDAPTLKFIHSLATHTPFVLNEDCRTLGPSSFDQLVPQARCALLAVATLLDALKATDIYDRTEILLLADHGIGVPRPGRSARPDDPEWARLAGYANPAFLLKRRGARGEVRHDASEVHLTDVGATLCASSGVCTIPRGLAVGESVAGRPRRFLHHEWRHEYWWEGTIPQVAVYEVRGPVWDPRSWRMVGEPRDTVR